MERQAAAAGQPCSSKKLGHDGRKREEKSGKTKKSHKDGGCQLRTGLVAIPTFTFAAAGGDAVVGIGVRVVQIVLLRTLLDGVQVGHGRHSPLPLPLRQRLHLPLRLADGARGLGGGRLGRGLLLDVLQQGVEQALLLPAVHLRQVLFAVSQGGAAPGLGSGGRHGKTGGTSHVGQRVGQQRGGVGRRHPGLAQHGKTFGSVRLDDVGVRKSTAVPHRHFVRFGAVGSLTFQTVFLGFGPLRRLPFMRRLDERHVTVSSVWVHGHRKVIIRCLAKIQETQEFRTPRVRVSFVVV